MQQREGVPGVLRAAAGEQGVQTHLFQPHRTEFGVFAGDFGEACPFVRCRRVVQDSGGQILKLVENGALRLHDGASPSRAFSMHCARARRALNRISDTALGEHLRASAKSLTATPLM